MKYLIVFSVIAAVASAGYLKPTPVASEVSEIQEIIAAINSPSTDPATAAALEQLLQATFGISSVQEPAPITTGPAVLDFPVPDGGVLTPGLVPVEIPAPVDAPIVPAVVAEAVAATPLVQIILNINQASDVAAVAPSPALTPIIESPVAVSPVMVVDEAVNVESPVAVAPVVVVDAAPVAPVVVVDAAPVAPVVVVDSVPETVQVVEVAPLPIQVVEVAPLPVQVVEVAPAPVMTLPDILN